MMRVPALFGMNPDDLRKIRCMAPCDACSLRRLRGRGRNAGFAGSMLVICQRTTCFAARFGLCASVRCIPSPFSAGSEVLHCGASIWAVHSDCGCRDRAAGRAGGGVDAKRPRRRREEGRHACPFGSRVGDSAVRWRMRPYCSESIRSRHTSSNLTIRYTPGKLGRRNTPASRPF